MLAVDTNVIVRYLIRDDLVQSGAARVLMDANQIFVCLSVLLETEWVLRSVYQFSPGEVGKALRAFAGLPCVTVEDNCVAAAALDWMEQGMDCADALHLGKAGDCSAFMTFDRKLVRLGGLTGIAVRIPQ